MAAVAWDRDVATMDLPMTPAPRLHGPLMGYMSWEIVFGEFVLHAGRDRRRVAVWRPLSRRWVVVQMGTPYKDVPL